MGSQGSQTGHKSKPWSRAAAMCLKYARSDSGIRGTHEQSLLWRSLDPRCAQNGSPGSTATAGFGSAATVASPIVGSTSEGTTVVLDSTGGAGGVIGSGSLM